MIHNFNDSLAISHEHAKAWWWTPIYSQSFRDFAGMGYMTEDGWPQRHGVDRVIWLQSGKMIAVEEKVRLENYNDVLLEIWSVWHEDKTKRTKGWATRDDLVCHYLTYVIIPSQQYFLFPFPQLRQAVRANGKEWRKKAKARCDGFYVKESPNEGYITKNLIVPTDVILSAVKGTIVGRWENR